jgi:tRNA-(ms[2]io[6]A)-hydroxylase
MNGIEITPILDFLPCKTTDGWLKQAKKPENLAVLLIDHANNELKAAQTAMSIINRYRSWLSQKEKSTNNMWYDLMRQMSRLAREEMRHFEQVLTIIKTKNINYYPLEASSYAKSLQAKISKTEPNRLIDTLIVGAFIEARSCERFYTLMPYLDDKLQAFYRQLVKSESRHFEVYLKLASKFSADCIKHRVNFFSNLEKSLVTRDDDFFRFHSGNSA